MSHEAISMLDLKDICRWSRRKSNLRNSHDFKAKYDSPKILLGQGKAIFEAPKCNWKSCFEASKSVSTEALALKDYYRCQGKNKLSLTCNRQPPGSRAPQSELFATGPVQLPEGPNLEKIQDCLNRGPIGVAQTPARATCCSHIFAYCVIFHLLTHFVSVYLWAGLWSSGANAPFHCCSNCRQHGTYPCDTDRMWSPKSWKNFRFYFSGFVSELFGGPGSGGPKHLSGDFFETFRGSRVLGSVDGGRDPNPRVPGGPKVEKISKSWQFQARSKISSEPPTKPLFLWEFSRSRLNISGDIEVFKRDWKFQALKRDGFFQGSGPLGWVDPAEWPGSGKKKEHKDWLFGSGDHPVGWGSSTRRGGGRKVRALPWKFVFLGFRREESGMSREFCRDVPDPWGCSKSLCKKVRAHFSLPTAIGLLDWGLGSLVSHYSAIGDTISCDAPYSAIGIRGKVFLRHAPC